MSTRGCIAIGTPQKWRGVYNHWDSYPTGLGVEVWQHVQTLLKSGRTLDDFAKDLLAYDDWRAYLNQGVCEYCGKKTSQPHTISGVICHRSGERFETKDEMRAHYRSFPAWRGRDADIERVVELEWQIRENIARCGYPDPDQKYHAHDTRPAEEQHITSENPDPLFIEWVYVVDPATATFHVLSHNGKAKPRSQPRAGELCRKDGNGRWDYGHCIFWHDHVASFPLSGPEPDWQSLESQPATDAAAGKRSPEP